MLEPKFCSYFGRLGLRLRQLRVFTNKAVIYNKSCMGTFFRAREPTPNKLRTNELRMNSEQAPNQLRTNSERTPNKLRTNSGRTRNKLRTSEQAPSELGHCSRANSEHTLAISMFLSPRILVSKQFFGIFRAYQKRPSDYTGQYQQVAWEGVFWGKQTCSQATC